MRRSMERMKNLEGRLRAGMTRNGVSPEAQDNIVHSISSFAMYGFPESHAASFALIAYASAYLKVHFLAALTCALLNNQPMGFYSPAVLIKDAQRHGLRMRPIDVQCSEAICSLEKEDEKLSLRIGFKYARGMRASGSNCRNQLRYPILEWGVMNWEYADSGTIAGRIAAGMRILS